MRQSLPCVRHELAVCCAAPAHGSRATAAQLLCIIVRVHAGVTSWCVSSQGRYLFRSVMLLLTRGYPLLLAMDCKFATVRQRRNDVSPHKRLYILAGILLHPPLPRHSTRLLLPSGVRVIRSRGAPLIRSPNHTTAHQHTLVYLCACLHKAALSPPPRLFAPSRTPGRPHTSRTPTASSRLPAVPHMHPRIITVSVSLPLCSYYANQCTCCIPFRSQPLRPSSAVTAPTLVVPSSSAAPSWANSGQRSVAARQLFRVA